MFELLQVLRMLSLPLDRLQDAQMTSAAFIQGFAIIQSNRDSKPPIECAETDRGNKLQYLEKFCGTCRL
jgi:hypothetical protein